MSGLPGFDRPEPTASERARSWLIQARALIQPGDRENVWREFIHASARAGSADLAVEAAIQAELPGPPHGDGSTQATVLPKWAFAIGAGRYDTDGIDWIDSPSVGPVPENQYAGALARAAVSGNPADLRVLLPRTDDPDRSNAMRRLGERAIRADHLEKLAGMAREARVAPELLVRQLAEAGFAELALSVIDVAVIPEARWGTSLAGPLGSVAAGLAARGDFDAAMAVADRCPGWERGEAISVAAQEWIKRNGPDSAARFRRLLRRMDSRPKAFIEGYVAEWRAEHADPTGLDHIGTLKGFPRFCAQLDAFGGYLRVGRLDLAEAAFELGKGNRGPQLEALANGWAEAGDLDRATEIVLRTTGESRSIAWQKVIETVAEAGRWVEAEQLALKFAKAAWLRAAVPAHLAWARAYQGDPDPFSPALRPTSRVDQAYVLHRGALGASRINPYRAAWI